MAATSPRSAASVAHKTQRPANSPATGLTAPIDTEGKAAPTCRTAMQLGGTSAAWSGAVSTATGNARFRSLVTAAEARRIVCTSPATKQPCIACASSRNALAIISGPMPAASPMVIAIGCAVGASGIAILDFFIWVQCAPIQVKPDCPHQ